MQILLVGLGNPGNDYENHRHNIGFRALDELAQAFQFPDFKVQGLGLVSKGKIDQCDVILLKPQTFMNLSGRALQTTANFYKIPIDHIYVVHDDIDLSPSKLRVKQGGGAGGHNGLKDIDQHMGKNYWRIRIGIGRPQHAQQVSHYVLSPFPKNEEEGWVWDFLRAFPKHIPYIIQGKAELFLNKMAQEMAV